MFQGVLGTMLTSTLVSVATNTLVSVVTNTLVSLTTSTLGERILKLLVQGCSVLWRGYASPRISK